MQGILLLLIFSIICYYLQAQIVVSGSIISSEENNPSLAGIDQAEEGSYNNSKWIPVRRIKQRSNLSGLLYTYPYVHL
jgi:hypothetical protein